MQTNHCEFTGRLVKAPTIKYLPSGQPLTEFTLAISRDYKKKGTQEWVKVEPMYLDTKLWQDYGKELANCNKGDRVSVSGKLDVETWNDKQTGQKRTKYVLRGFELEIPQSGKSYGSRQPPTPHTRETIRDDNDAFDRANAELTEGYPNDEIPF